MTAYNDLMAFQREPSALGQIAGRLGWDQETVMPRGAAPQRRRAMQAALSLNLMPRVRRRGWQTVGLAAALLLSPALSAVLPRLLAHDDAEYVCLLRSVVCHVSYSITAVVGALGFGVGGARPAHYQ